MATGQRRRVSSRFQDLTGRTFGRWTVLRFVRRCERMHGCYFLCRCECGREREVFGPSLTAEKSRGCKSCVHRTHGETQRQPGVTTEYRLWVAMKNRCFGSGHNARNHGARGVRVCLRWRDCFEDFLADMGRRPADGLSIDRIDNDGHYSCGKCEDCQGHGWPMNCRWATPLEQAANTRMNVHLTLDGMTRHLNEWARVIGLHATTIRHRLATGMSVEQALTTPKRKGGRPQGS